MPGLGYTAGGPTVVPRSGSVLRGLLGGPASGRLPGQPHPLLLLPVPYRPSGPMVEARTIPTSETFADGFESGDLLNWTTTSGSVAASAAAKMLGAFGGDFDPANTAAQIGTSTAKWTQGAYRHATARVWLRVDAAPAGGVSGDLFTVQNALQVNNFDFFINTSGRFQFDLLSTDSVDTGITPVVGRWYDVEVQVDYGETTYTATVRINGVTQTVVSSAGQTPSTVRSLVIGTASTTKTYSFSVDEVRLDASVSPAPFFDTWADLADTASGADALSVAATVPLSEAATGADALSVAASVPLSETATGADALSLTAAVTLTEAATGADALSVAATVPLSETATGVDALSVAASVTLTDAASGADALTVDAGSNSKTLTDAASGADALSVAASVPLTEAATGADALSVAASVPLSETATGADALALAQTRTLTEAATGTDALTVAQTHPLADTATGTDALSVAASVTLTEAATGTDALTVRSAADLTETATGVDALSVAVRVGLADVVVAAESIIALAAAALAETATGTDALTVTRVGVDPDLAVALASSQWAVRAARPRWSIGITGSAWQVGTPTSKEVAR